MNFFKQIVKFHRWTMFANWFVLDDLLAYAAIASAVGSAGAAVANKNAQDQDINSRNDKLLAESIRQQGLQKKADVVNDATQGQFDRGAQDDLQANQDAIRNKFIQQSISTPQASDAAPISNGAPKIVDSELARKVGDAISDARGLGTAQAHLGGYGATQFQNDINIGRAGQQLGQVNDSSQNSTDVLSLELQKANHAGDSNRTLADLFRVGGSAASAYIGTRGGKTVRAGGTAPTSAGNANEGLA